MKFAKGGEQNYTTVVFRIIKVICRTTRPVYDLANLNRRVINVQFYNEELTPMRISRRTNLKIDKILSTRVRRGIREYLVRWKGYGPDFDSWVNAASVKNINKMDYGNHFYITLFSNASPETCPNNTLAEFTVQLAQNIDLGSIGSWEVGSANLIARLRMLT
jgi:hypothetical protein